MTVGDVTHAMTVQMTVGMTADMTVARDEGRVVQHHALTEDGAA